MPHLDGERFGAFVTDAAARTEAQNEVIAFSDALIDELRRADVIVLGLPMYNFGIPSTLKAYFDHIARAGVTFRYTADGPEGLLKGKKAVVFATGTMTQIGVVAELTASVTPEPSPLEVQVKRVAWVISIIAASSCRR